MACTCPWQSLPVSNVRYHIDIIPSSLEGFGFLHLVDFSTDICGGSYPAGRRSQRSAFLPETLASNAFLRQLRKVGEIPNINHGWNCNSRNIFRSLLIHGRAWSHCKRFLCGCAQRQSEMIHMPVTAQKERPVRVRESTDHMSRSPWCQTSWNQGSQFLWCSWWYQLYCVGCLPASAWILARLQLGPQYIAGDASGLTSNTLLRP